MIIYLDTNFNIVSALPERAGQFSQSAGVVMVAGKFASTYQITIAFRLPDGTYATETPGQNSTTAAVQFLLSLSSEVYSDMGFNLWSRAIPTSVTQQSGTVQYTLYIYAGDGVYHTSRTGEFSVTHSIPTDLVAPDADVLQAIYDAFASFSAVATDLKSALYGAGATDTYTVPADNTTVKRLGAAEATIADHEERVDTLEAASAEHETRVATAEGEIDALQAQAAAVPSDISTAVSNHNDSGTAHADIRTAIAGNSAALNTHKDDTTAHATAIASAISAHNGSGTTHADIRETATTALGVAQGKTKSYVFDDYDEMYTFLGLLSNTLKIGDNLFIRELDTPDYWWDGSWIQPLETTKADLTVFADKVTGATSGNLAGLDADGNLTDSGLSSSLVLTKASIVNVTSSRTLGLDDVGKVLKVTAASVITIPSNADVAIKVDDEIAIVSYTTGLVSIAPATGVTLNSSLSFRTLYGQYSSAALKKVDTDEWLLIGALKG